MAQTVGGATAGDREYHGQTSVRNTLNRARALIAALPLRLHTYWAVLTARGATQRNLRRPARRVLVVCYGNIYRSAFLGAYLAERVRGRCEVRSSGFHQVVGRPCPKRHVAQAAARGVDLTSHRSSRITPQDLAWADVVVVMDRHNWYALRELGVRSDKMVWAGALTRGRREIADPFDLSDQAAAETIDRLIESGDKLASLLGARVDRASSD